MTGVMAALLGSAGGGGGGGGAVVTINDQSLSDFKLDGSAVGASYYLGTDGAVRRRGFDGGLEFIENWVNPTGADKAAFQVRATRVSGAIPNEGASLSLWLNMTTNLWWGLAGGGGDSLSTELLVEIRSATTLAVLDSASVLIAIESIGGGGGF